jgi:hypothetical protein
MSGRVRAAALLVGLVLLGGAAGCGDDDGGGLSAGGADQTTTDPDAGLGDEGDGVRPAPPAGEPSVTGTVSAVSAVEVTQECDTADPDGADPDDPVSSDDDPSPGCAKPVDLLGSFMVEDGVDPGGAALAARVTVTASIAILAEDGAGGWSLASFDDLVEGARVQVWFDGPVAESYPVQARAGSIVIEA